MGAMAVVAREEVVATGAAQRHGHVIASVPGDFDHCDRRGVGERSVVRLRNGAHGVGERGLQLGDVVRHAQPPRDRRGGRDSS